MKIQSKNIKNNYLDPVYGNNTHEELINGKVKKSFHISWKDLPHGTKSLALNFYDDDAIPVAGFTWVHWLVANINPALNELSINASIDLKDELIQGKNSWASGLLPKEVQDHDALFGGPAPPNEDHEYTLEVYALDKTLNLENGFLGNDFKKSIRGHVLEVTKLTFMYQKVK